MPIHLPEGLMVSVSGVRGRVGDPLTPELMCGVAAAFGAHLRELEGEGPVCLGRDSRVSGPSRRRSHSSDGPRPNEGGSNGGFLARLPRWFAAASLDFCGGL